MQHGMSIILSYFAQETIVQTKSNWSWEKALKM